MVTVHDTLHVPSPWVAAYLAPASPNSSPNPAALDVACGPGRHLRIAHRLGYRVTGIDRDVSGVADLAQIDGIALLSADLENGDPWPLPGVSFQAVIVTNYLHRPRLPDIVAAVSPDGVLIYETFAVGNERLGRPTNPDFLLRPGELLAATHGVLTPIAFQHATLCEPKRVVQRIIAVGRGHAWLADPPAHAGEF